MSAWAEHVSAALLGTQRRPVPAISEAPEGTAGGDPAGRLLDQAAVLTLRRRAGRRPGQAEPIAPAPAETAPVAPPDAVRRLARILASGDQIRLLPEWLAAAGARGVRVPPRLLPELLERGRQDRALRPAIAGAAGRLGVWLALRNTDWAYLISEGADPGGDDPEVWQTGTRNQRVAYLIRLRGADPAGARAALRETWAGEPAPDRAAFLATLEHGLSLADEEFLEAALDDRGKDVRQLAADLLARLPGSAYGRRMAARARACLHPRERTVRLRTQTWIIAEPPRGHDEDMARDGVPFHPAGSFAPGRRVDSPVGARSGWLREILARTPLTTWTELFERSPMEVVCLPIADALDPGGRHQDGHNTHSARDVHIGWVRAAVRQRDAGWARALLKGGVVVDEVEALADLLSVLPEAERDAAAADLLRWAEGFPDLLRVLERIPGPWTGELADAVVGLLAAPETAVVSRTGESYGHRREHGLAQLCRLADERLIPDVAPRLEALAERHPDAWPLTELTETLRFRHEMLKELM